jgi:DNA-binding CsgD family transcriptional regulator/PAS domain-containing protein
MKPQEKHDLIGLLYNAALNPTAWRDVFERLLLHLRADVGNFFIWDNALQRPSFYTFHGGEQQGALEYAEYFGAIDPHTRLLAELPVGTVVNCSEHFDQRYVDQSEFYQDFFKRFDIRWTLGMRTASFDNQDGVLGILRAPGKPFGDKDKRLIDELNPHLHRITKLQHRLQQAAFESTLGLAALNTLSQAALIISGDGEVMFANAAAESLLRGADALTLKHGRLTTTDPAGRLALERCVSQAITLSSGNAIQLQRSGGAPPLTMTVLPLAPHSTLNRHWERPMALVFVSDPAHIPEGASSRWRRLYGLSGAEARLAEALLRGHSTTEYAQSTGLTMNTIRTQLKALFAKTGTRRQAELVRLLAEMTMATGGD